MSRKMSECDVCEADTTSISSELREFAGKLETRLDVGCMKNLFTAESTASHLW